MSKKIKIVTFIILLSISCFILKDTLAISSISKYDFYIKENISYGDEKIVNLSDTVNDEKLIEGKIAPGTSGSFEISINIAENVIAMYKLSFGDFKIELPQNLKFYLDEEEINLKDFSLVFMQSGKTQTHYFEWEWEYETKDGDYEDTLASSFGDIEFSIILETEYEKLDTGEKTEKLPRSGDIKTNFRERR